MRLLGLFLFLLSSWALSDSLNVYTYDGMVGKSSFGEVLKKSFEKKTGTTLNLISFSSAGEALNQIIIEGDKTKADILLGVDSGFAARARSTHLFLPISKAHFSDIQEIALLGTDRLFLPYDYGFLAFLYNRKKVSAGVLPKTKMSLVDFLNLKNFKKKIVIQDPRTSSVGYSFLRWTQEACPTDSDLKKCWESLFPKLLTIAPSWSGAYGIFLKGEADWVLSYTTSRAYHLEKEKNDQYDVLVFDGGHALQSEAAAVLKTSKKSSQIDSFLELLVSNEIQKELPLTQWMYPSRAGVSLPESFKGLPVPKAIENKKGLTEDERKKLLRDWTQWASESQ